MGHITYIASNLLQKYKLKSDLIHIEENHPLGRLVDLDLYIYGKNDI